MSNEKNDGGKKEQPKPKEKPEPPPTRLVRDNEPKKK
jgi:hypothetical protein